MTMPWDPKTRVRTIQAYIALHGLFGKIERTLYKTSSIICMATIIIILAALLYITLLRIIMYRVMAMNRPLLDLND